MPTVTHSPTVYVRHEGAQAVVDLALTVAATCQGCGEFVGRRVTTDDEQQAAIQEFGPWAIAHAEACHAAVPALTAA